MGDSLSQPKGECTCQPRPLKLAHEPGCPLHCYPDIAEAITLAEMLRRATHMEIVVDLGTRYVFSKEQLDLARAALEHAQSASVAQAGRESQYRAALEEIGRYAKKIRKSKDLVGPAEYVTDAWAMKVWERALYHEGKTIEGMVKAALHGAEIFEPEKSATSPLPSTPRQTAAAPHHVIKDISDDALFNIATEAWSTQTDYSWSSDGLEAAVLAVRSAVEEAPALAVTSTEGQSR